MAAGIGMRMQLLVIERDQYFTRWLSAKLASAGFVSLSAATPEQAMRRGLVDSAIAIVLDSGPNDLRCPETVRSLRSTGIDKPLLVLSAQSDWQAKVDNLDAGADDFLCKPVRSEEVAARLRALIRRSNGNSSSVIRLDDIELDMQARCAWRKGQCLALTRSEFRLLQLFLLYPDKTMTQREIQDYLQPDMVGHSPNAVEVLIARLRKKVGRDRIRTFRNLGYRMIKSDMPDVASVTTDLIHIDEEMSASRQV